MTPRADGTGGGPSERIPSLHRSSQKLSRTRSIRGACTSAPDKPIFDSTDVYVDRAAQRRIAAKLESEEVIPAASWDCHLAHDDALSRPPSRPPSEEAKPSLIYKSKMAERLCKSMIEDDQWKDQERRPVQTFLPGKMAYVYDLTPNKAISDWDVSLCSRMVLRSQLQTSSSVLSPDPPEIFELVREACAPKASSLTVNVDAVGPFEDENIFPDVGDYVFEEKQTQSSRVKQLPLFASAPLVESPLPMSLEGLMRELEAPRMGSSEKPPVDDYEECYPGVYQSAMDMFDDDDDAEAVSDKAKATKRQMAAKDRHKLTRTISKVSKIMESKKHSS